MGKVVQQEKWCKMKGVLRYDFLLLSSLDNENVRFHKRDQNKTTPLWARNFLSLFDFFSSSALAKEKRDGRRKTGISARHVPWGHLLGQGCENPHFVRSSLIGGR